MTVSCVVTVKKTSCHIRDYLEFFSTIAIHFGIYAVETDNCRLIIIIFNSSILFPIPHYIMRVLPLPAGEGPRECFAREYFLDQEYCITYTCNNLSLFKLTKALFYLP